MKWNNLIYILLFSGIGAFSYLLLVNSADQISIADKLYSGGAFIFFILAFNVLGYSTLRISSWINTQYTVSIRSRWKIPTIYITVMLLNLLLNYSLMAFAKILAGASHPFTIVQSSGWQVLIGVWLVELVILGLLLANRSMLNALKLQKKTAKLQAENDTARYTALQNQLNPHFLFNSLNTLIAEIEYNPENAVSFTKHLSSVYRYVLQSQHKTLVTLNEELEFTRSYLFLHEVRLGNCLNCKCHIPADDMECQLPPLTLQLLVENVIKHNSITQSKPMTITILIENEYLVISNPVHPKKGVSSSGVGLQNLAKRCMLMSGKNIIIEPPLDNLFTVKVPLLYE